MSDPKSPKVLYGKHAVHHKTIEYPTPVLELASEKQWDADRAALSNKMYAEIFCVLKRYESPNANAHQKTQSIVEAALEKADTWILLNTRSRS